MACSIWCSESGKTVLMLVGSGVPSTTPSWAVGRYGLGQSLKLMFSRPSPAREPVTKESGDKVEASGHLAIETAEGSNGRLLGVSRWGRVDQRQ